MTAACGSGSFGSGSGTSSSTVSPTPAQCGDGLASQDLAGRCRAAPTAMGALEAEDGVIATAALSAAGVQSASRQVLVTWQPYSTDVSGYVVYYGTTPDNTSIYASDLSVASGAVNPLAPSVTYDATRDLSLSAGQSVCFRVYAYDGAHTLSDRSELTCTVV
jgi:hypothetical protein